MSRSISQRLRIVLAMPLAHYRHRWLFIAACGSCTAEAEVTVAGLLEAHARRTIAQTIERLRCKRSGQPPAAIVLQSRPSTYAGHVEVVRLRGAGTYA